MKLCRPSRIPAVEIAAFVLLALSMALPSGYSIGAILLLALSAWSGLRWLAARCLQALPFALWALVIVLMGAVWLLHTTDPGAAGVVRWKAFDRPSKYLLVLALLPVLARARLGARALFWGAATGSAGAGAIALWQVFHLHLPRAEGYTNAIQFGDLSLLLALWSAVWALHAPRPWQRGLAAAAALLGLGASVLSDTRGGWLVLPLLAFMVLWWGARARRAAWSARQLAQRLGIVVVLCAAIVALPPVHQRIAEAVHEYASWDRGDAASSVGQRLVLWQMSLQEVRVRPWVGIGGVEFRELLKDAVARGAVPQEIATLGHAHNELLDMLVKRGILGLLALLLFYVVPGWLFWRALRTSGEDESDAASTDRRAAALCGLTLIVGFVGFGLTQVLFAHNNGNLMYLLCVSLWLAACQPGRSAAAVAGPPSADPSAEPAAAN